MQHDNVLCHLSSTRHVLQIVFSLCRSSFWSTNSSNSKSSSEKNVVIASLRKIEGKVGEICQSGVLVQPVGVLALRLYALLARFPRNTTWNSAANTGDSRSVCSCSLSRDNKIGKVYERLCSSPAKLFTFYRPVLSKMPQGVRPSRLVSSHTLLA